MKNNKLIKFLFIVLGLSGLCSVAYGHGSIELVECHNKDNTVILRGEAQNKMNDFDFVLMKDNAKVWSGKNIRLKLTDTVEDKKLYENIAVNGKDGNKVDIKVLELATREIRNGTGRVAFSKPQLKEDVSCYAVY